nr:hydrogenase iron-sulfur subunit [Thermodesulforhabdus norvegica]
MKKFVRLRRAPFSWTGLVFGISDEMEEAYRSEEPEIVAFCCMYCAYAAADMAGSMRLNYPSNVKIILVPCTGRVEVDHILEAFDKGADGVYVAGCEEGSCHFERGNIRAKRRVEYVKKILEELGLEPERVEMFHISASQGHLFAKVAGEMTERIRKVGILGWNKSHKG